MSRNSKADRARGERTVDDARLIAAAPELLAALKRVVTSLASIEGSGPLDEGVLSALREYVAKAINKAEEG